MSNRPPHRTDDSKPGSKLGSTRTLQTKSGMARTFELWNREGGKHDGTSCRESVVPAARIYFLGQKWVVQKKCLGRWSRLVVAAAN